MFYFLKKTILYSQPILVGRQIGGEQKNGGGYLEIVNVSNRTIKINYEIRDVDAHVISHGYANVEPGRRLGGSALIGGTEMRHLMYCKIWFRGYKKEIRASFIMKTIEGSPGNETITPVYAVSLS